MMTTSEVAEAQSLLRWGPRDLPPLDRATPAGVERAMLLAAEHEQSAVAAIVANPAPATFENTIAALEDAHRDLRIANGMLTAFLQTRAVEEMPGVGQRLAGLMARIDDENAHNATLFERIQNVFANCETLEPEERRLTETTRERFLRRGAGLPGPARNRLVEINRRIAQLQTLFDQHLIAEQDSQAVFVDSAETLAGLPASSIAAAAQAAVQLGEQGRWAIRNTRPSVWPVLTFAHDRDLRRRVRDMWATRGAHEGTHDNRPVLNEILKLRGEKAKLLGYPSYAHYAMADRMAATPEVAMELMQRAWGPVYRKTQEQLSEMQSIAESDGLSEPLEAWDRLYYAEQLRRARFNLDAQAVREYLTLDSVVAAIFDAASRLHGLTFETLADAPVLHPDVRAYRVEHHGALLGVLYLDLLYREGKMRGSWQFEYRSAESYRGEVHAISSVNSNLERTPDGNVLLGWEYANVLFHEVGHALHMLFSRAAYPALASIGTAWDMIELPSLLNERYLFDRDLLRRFAKHYQTGDPIPFELVDAIEQGLKFDRVFSVQLDFLASSIIDMRLHLLADGRDIDAVEIESATLSELGMLRAIDPVMNVTHFYHTVTDAYAAGVYSYLWSDVMAADAAEAFLEAPGGLYDRVVAERWRSTILSVGNTVPAAQAFRNFRGRDPQPEALFRRFDLGDGQIVNG